MQIDIQHERLLTLREATVEFPGIKHRHVCYETVRRYATVGINGVRLETVKAGGLRRTTREAIQRFINRLTEMDRQSFSSGESFADEKRMIAAECAQLDAWSRGAATNRRIDRLAGRSRDGEANR